MGFCAVIEVNEIGRKWNRDQKRHSVMADCPCKVRCLYLYPCASAIFNTPFASSRRETASVGPQAHLAATIARFTLPP